MLTKIKQDNMPYKQPKNTPIHNKDGASAVGILAGLGALAAKLAGGVATKAAASKAVVAGSKIAAKKAASAGAKKAAAKGAQKIATKGAKIISSSKPKAQLAKVAAPDLIANCLRLRL